MPSESDEVLAWVQDYLARDEDIVVPIKKMWNEWHAAHVAPSLEVFTAMVLADEQVEELGEVDHTDDMEGLSAEELDEYVRNMEAQGYYSGPRVKLRSRELTLEHIARMLKRHNDRMEEALRQARAALPADVSEEEEGQLIEVMALAEELRRRLREVGLEADDESSAAP